MKYTVTATSSFHGPQHFETFRGIEMGDNIRRLKHKRNFYCLDYNSANTHVCGCGFPCSRTNWEVRNESGEIVGNLYVAACECGRNGGQGTGGILINLHTLGNF